jgi:hypothetical protein
LDANNIAGGIYMHGKHGYKEPKKLEGKMDGITSYKSDDNSGKLGCGRSTRCSAVSPDNFILNWYSHTCRIPEKCWCWIQSNGMCDLEIDSFRNK